MATSIPRRDAGFTIFYIGINTGAFFGPLICGWLAANPRFGWSYGFGAAGVGMALGVICFLLLRKKYLGDTGMVPMAQTRMADGGKAVAEPLTKEEKDRVVAIIIVVFFVAFFWLAFEQAGSSLNVFAQQKTQRAVGAGLAAWCPTARSRRHGSSRSAPSSSSRWRRSSRCCGTGLALVSPAPRSR